VRPQPNELPGEYGVFLFFIFHFSFFCVLLYDIHFHNNNSLPNLKFLVSPVPDLRKGV